MSEFRKMDFLYFLAIASIVIAGAVARLRGLEHECLGGDELASFVILDEPGLFSYLSKLRTDYDTQMVPVYFAIQYGIAAIAGVDMYSQRLISVIFGVLALGAAMALARLLYGRYGALVVGVCMALSPMHVRTSQEVRMYALQLLLLLLSFVCYACLVQTGRRRWLALNVVLNCLAMWTHMMSLLAIGVQVLDALCRRKRLGTRNLVLWILFHGAILASIAVWIATMNFSQVAQVTGWITAPGLIEAVSSTSWLTEHAVVLGLSGRTAELITAGIFCTLLFFFLLRVRAAECTPFPSRKELGVLGVALLPPLFLYGVSVLGKPVFVPRYFLFSSVAVYLIVAGVLDSIRGKQARIAALAVLTVFLAISMLRVDLPFRTDWMAARKVWRECQPEPAVLLFPQQRIMVVNYYMGAFHAEQRTYSDVEEFMRTIVECLQADKSVGFLADRRQYDLIQEKLRKKSISWQEHRLPGRSETRLCFIVGAQAVTMNAPDARNRDTSAGPALARCFLNKPNCGPYPYFGIPAQRR